MRIVFLDEYSLGGADLSAIKALGDYRGYEITMEHDLIVERARDAEVIICNKSPLPRRTLEALPHLRLVCIAATGTNNIDSEAAAELGIEVRNAAGYSTHSVAEATIGATLALLRNTAHYDNFIKSGRYSASDRLFSFERAIGQIHSSRWGIIGLGTIGREVARIATALGSEVRYFSTSGVARDEEYRRAERLEELLGWCDILSIHSPLNDQTRGLVGEKEMAQMQQNSILINVARGGIVDEAALATALNSGVIAGAAIDVFGVEPLEKSSPLLTAKNIILSPHNAWSSREAIKQLVEIVAEGVRSRC